MASGPRYVKICGVTRAQDADECVAAGASAIGLNFVPSSRRCITEDVARVIADRVRGKVELVGVVANMPIAEMRGLRDRLGLDMLQLHGEEADAVLLELLPGAFKVVRIGSSEDSRLAEAVPGTRILADAKVTGSLGGTGTEFDWSLVRRLAAERDLVLAGGLTPENVLRAVQLVRPFGVDVASGVESAPGIKDAERVRLFVRRARGEAA